MKPLTGFSLLLFISVLVIAAVACSGDSDGADDGTSVPAATATPTLPTTTPETPPSPSPTQAPATETPAPPLTGTGTAAVDEVIEAVLDRDAAALEALLRFSEVPCTHEFGGGGPPKCFAYQPAPAEGTPVQAFPLSTCEGEWRPELAPIVAMLFERDLALYGVVELNLDAPLFGLDYYPQPEYGVLLQQTFNGETAGILLGVEAEGGVTYISFFCFPPPDWIFSDQAKAVYGDGVELIFEGPAYTTP